MGVKCLTSFKNMAENLYMELGGLMGEHVREICDSRVISELDDSKITANRHCILIKHVRNHLNSEEKEGLEYSGSASSKQSGIY